MADSPTSRKVSNPKTRFNWRVSDFIRGMMVRWFELRARITGRAYYCSTLAGQEDYNLTVNSDLTVSCCCQDYDGSGHIGDLRKNTFEEIYFGPVAQRFRDELAKGKIPIPTCVRCTIRRLPQKTAPPKPQLPYRGMLLENTVLCNVVARSKLLWFRRRGFRPRAIQAEDMSWARCDGSRVAAVRDPSS